MEFQASEDFYKLLFDNANDGILLTDLDAQNFYVANKAICKMLGYSYEEIKNLGVADIHPKEDLPYVMGQFERQVRGKIGENILAKDMPVKRKDGSIFYTDIGASRVKLAGRMYLMGIFRDITDRRQIEKDLENVKIAVKNVYDDLQVEKEELIKTKVKDEALLESIGEGVVAIDQDGKIMLMNHAAERMLGWSAEEVMGKLLVEVWKVLDEKENLIPEATRPIANALKVGITTINSSYFYIRKDGTKLPVAISITPVMVDNKIIGAIGAFRDITKEKEIEKLRMDFLSLASHQLRTPLSGTKWLVETMQRGILGKITQKQKEYIDQIYQVNERMIQLVSEMLSVLRLEGGAHPIKKEAVLISSLYEDIPILMMAAAKSKKIVLDNNLKEHKNVTIETDKEILKSILECFISNAINYSEIGQEVILDMEEETAAVVFSVRDNGIGIPKEEQKRIFERFYRASNAKSFRPTGSGLGLNITKTLSEKIGAKISFKSKENKGSIFYLCIPKGSNEGAKVISKKSKIKI